MALTITPLNYYQYGKCDALADLEGTWTGNSAGTESDFYKEGAGCLGFTLRTVGNNDITYTKSSSVWDLSGTKHLRIWILTTAANFIQTLALGGIQFWVTDGTNTGYYYVSGKDNYPGGWYNLVVDLSRSVDSGVKPTMTAITAMGLRVIMTSSPKNIDNTWIDNLIRCDGLACDSDTQFGLTDIYGKDDATTGAWGIIRRIGGIYYLTGSLQVGVGSGSTSCDFKDTSQTIVFENRLVNSSLYGISLAGNTGTNKLQLGDKSGAAGISGCSIRTQSLTQTPKFTIGVSSPGVNDVFKLYGCSILDSGVVTLPTNTANREVLNSNFEACGQVLASTCIMTNCNFISADADAILISNDPYYVTSCNFINCPNGVELDTVGDGEYNFSALKFTGTTNHVNNTSGSALTVGNSAGSNASTYTGSAVAFQSSVTLKMIVKNEAGAGMNGVKAYIDNNDQSPFIMNTLTANVGGVDGVAQTGYVGSPISGAKWRARLFGYKPFSQLIDIGSEDITLPITMVVDSIVL